VDRGNVPYSVHSLTEDITDDVKGRFHGELECVSDKIRKYNMQLLLRDFGAKVGKGDILTKNLE
jgi:hypothetical protein